MGKMYKNRTPAEAFSSMPGKKMEAMMKPKKKMAKSAGKSKDKSSFIEKFDKHY